MCATTWTKWTFNLYHCFKTRFLWLCKCPLLCFRCPLVIEFGRCRCVSGCGAGRVFSARALIHFTCCARTSALRHLLPFYILTSTHVSCSAHFFFNLFAFLHRCLALSNLLLSPPCSFFKVLRFPINSWVPHVLAQEAFRHILFVLYSAWEDSCSHWTALYAAV